MAEQGSRDGRRRGTPLPSAPAIGGRRRRALPSARLRCGAAGPSVRGRGADALCGPALRRGGAWDRAARAGSRIHRRSPVRPPPIPRGASSTSLARRPVARVRSAKKDAPRFSMRGQHFARRVGKRSLGDGCGVASSQAASSRRKMASGATRVGRTRRPRFSSGRVRKRDAARGVPSSLRPTGTSWSRYSGLYLRHARGRTSGSHAAAANSQPCNCRTICSVPSTPWSWVPGEVLPAMQESVELGRGDGLDLAPQAADGEAVDARQQAAVAPFDFAAGRWRETGRAESGLRLRVAPATGRPDRAAWRASRRVPSARRGPEHSNQPRRISAAQASGDSGMARAGGAAMGRVDGGLGIDAANQVEPLGGDPEVARPVDCERVARLVCDSCWRNRGMRAAAGIRLKPQSASWSSSASRMAARLRQRPARWRPGRARRRLPQSRRAGCGATAPRGRGALRAERRPERRKGWR